MSLFREVLAGLLGMFVADARLSLAILGLVGLSAAIVALGGAGLLAGAVLLFGSLGLVVGAVLRAARRKVR